MWCGQGHLLRDLTGGAGARGPHRHKGRQAGVGILGQGRRGLTGTEALSPPWQRCSHCTRLGASIPCRSPGCLRLYHFPCAAASGSFLSMKTLQLLCPEHSDGAAHLGEEPCPLARGRRWALIRVCAYVLSGSVNIVSLGVVALSGSLTVMSRAWDSSRSLSVSFTPCRRTSLGCPAPC